MQSGRPENRLKELREAHDFKLYDVASKLRKDPSTVHRWETGKAQIPDEIKFALAEMFEVSVPYLMGWEKAAA